MIIIISSSNIGSSSTSSIGIRIRISITQPRCPLLFIQKKVLMLHFFNLVSVLVNTSSLKRVKN